jgi:hypothetical protein
MNIHILLVSLFFNANVAFNYCVLMIFSSLYMMFLLILCNFVTYCFDLIAYCNSAVFMTNSTFNSTCADDGSVNIYVHSHLVSNFLDRGKCSLLIQNRSSPTCISFHKDYNFYPKQIDIQ